MTFSIVRPEKCLELEGIEVGDILKSHGLREMIHSDKETQ
jgi:hypothetical protein